MLLLRGVILGGILFSPVLAFIAPSTPNTRNFQPSCRSLVMSAEREAMPSRKDFVAGMAALGLSLVAAGAAPQQAGAEQPLAQRKAQYFRYVPRINKGRDILANDLKAAIEKKDWKAVSSLFVDEQNAPSTSMRNNPKKVQNKFESNLYDPMKIWANTFAEKGSSPKLTALLESVGKLEAALARVQKAATGDLRPVGVGDGGFFGFLGGGGSDVADPYKGKSQVEIISGSYAAAKEAYNEYVSTANQGLSLELLPLQPLP